MYNEYLKKVQDFFIDPKVKTADILTIKERIAKQVLAFEQQAYREAGIPVLEAKRDLANVDAGEKAKAELVKLARDFFSGMHGRGTLVVISDEYADGSRAPMRFARVLDLKDVFGRGMDHAIPTFERLIGPPEKVLNPDTAQADYGFRWNSPFEESNLPRWVEVTVQGTTDEEFAEVYRGIRELLTPMEVRTLFAGTPINPLFKPGDQYNFGSDEYRGTRVVGSVIYLPSKRFAVYSNFSLHAYIHRQANSPILGVLPSDDTLPRWSAENGIWCGTPLLPLNFKEKDFIKSLKMYEWG